MRGSGRAFLVQEFSDKEVRAIRDAGNLESLFRVYVADRQTVDLWNDTQTFAPGELPPLGGEYSFYKTCVFVSGTVCGHFMPQFPLDAGLSYIAVFGEFAGAPRVVELFEIPAKPKISTASVERVYPSGNVLPENLLKFYLHFTEPMRRGGVYEF
ncbi:MAG: hypothetical protein ACI9VS_003902, partial [Candidatus Binatia bacterium]